MDDHHSILTWALAKDAILVASDIDRSLEDRLDCTKFLFRLNKNLVTLNYEGTKFEVYFTIWAIVSTVKQKYGTEKAYEELIKFYPDLASTEIYDSIYAGLFDLTPSTE